MGTSLTAEFWRLFAVLLVSSMAVTFVLSAVLDALAVRARQRRARRGAWDTRVTEAARRTERTERTPVHH